MGSALWIAISGLNASSKQMDVIGNNIANSNTMGFKTGKTYFANVLSQSLSGGAVRHHADRPGRHRGRRGHPVQPGLPRVHLQRTRPGHRRRRLLHRRGRRGSQYFTRAGAFHIDGEGYLVDINNYRVQGYAPSSPTLGDLNTRNSQSAPVLPRTSPSGSTSMPGPLRAAVFNSSQTVYDTLGTAHTLAVTYTKTDGCRELGLAVTLDGAAAASQNYTGFIFDGNGDLDKVYNAGNLATHPVGDRDGPSEPSTKDPRNRTAVLKSYSLRASRW